jgi:pimeloyl-ACP methyl ester carboxylesterase
MKLDRPRERIIGVDGLRLFVREEGRGHPLLMLNGLGGHLEMWTSAAQLAGGSRTICFDAPGIGRSPLPIRFRSVKALSNVGWQLLDELGYDRVDILGFSLGGLIAQEMARREPSRVRRLALVATSCGWGGMPGSLSALAAVALPIRYYSRSLYDRTNWLLGEPNDRAVRAQADIRLRYPPSLLGYAYQFLAGAIWSSLPWVSELQAPTLVVAGEHDQLVPAANSVQLARLLPQSRLHLLPDEGHLVMYDPESAAHSLLAEFFSAADHSDTAAWRTGAAVEEDEVVEEALRAAGGAQPWRAASGVFRWLVADAL